MSAVNLNRIKPNLHRFPRRLGKRLDQALDLLHRQLLGRLILRIVGNRTWRNNVIRPPAVFLRSQRVAAGRRQPRRKRARLAARVCKLDANLGALAVRKVDNALERRDLRILPQARVLRGDAAAGLDGCGLDKDEARAAHGHLAQVHQVVVGQVAVVGAVLAHGAGDDAVRHRHASGGDGLEQRRRGGRVGCCAGLGFLGRRVVWHARSGLVFSAGGAHFARRGGECNVRMRETAERCRDVC